MKTILVISILMAVSCLTIKFNFSRRYTASQISTLGYVGIIDESGENPKYKHMSFGLFIFEVFLMTSLAFVIDFYLNLGDTMPRIFFPIIIMFSVLNIVHYSLDEDNVYKKDLLKISNLVSITVHSVNAFKLDAFIFYNSYKKKTNLAEYTEIIGRFIKLMDTYYEYVNNCKTTDSSVESVSINAVFLKHIVHLKTIITIINDEKLMKSLTTELGKEEKIKLLSKLDEIHADLKLAVTNEVEQRLTYETLNSLNTISSMYTIADSIK